MIYSPTHSELDIMKLQMRLKIDESFKKVFKVNLTESLIKEAKAKTQAIGTYQQHFVGVCYGLTGKGKSMGMLSFAKTIYPNIKVENIFFHNQQIIDAMNTLQAPNIIFRDENVESAQYGSGSTRVKTQLEAITQTLRKKGISFIFVGVDDWNLSSAQYKFEAIDMDRKRRITRFGVIDPETQHFLGAMYLKVMAENDPFWLTYNQKKDEFMDTIINMDFSKGKPMYQKIIDDLLSELNIFKYQNKKERKLYIRQRYSNFTNIEIDEISTMLEIQLRENDELRQQSDGNNAPVQT